ncbi:actin-binding protein anillin [Elysia marginata]|uniref:Actin-binding protein anillin n=1 Tax=Elysia marginata TaxID=1093978 RepID=A0AAV4FDS1_9GAST|nr:actin-binding protein anillin [Elysia marginata]
MDADTRTLIERTRQRREILNQRFAGMPEAAPRKRRTPVLENESTEKKISATEDDSPKRQCLRNVEINVKPDTPAIRGVQSRIKDLKTGESQSENGDGETPTPRPRKSVSSPPLEKKSLFSPKNSPVKTPAPSSARKNRFAALAQSINNWEDDLTHHVIHKEEEKKPRWQPPQTTANSPGTPKKGTAPGGSEMSKASPAKANSSSQLKSFKENRCASPTKAVGSPAKTTHAQSVRSEVMSSPKRTPAPPVPRDKTPISPASALSRNSPLRTSKVDWNRSPKPFSSTYMDNAVSPSKAVIKSVASPKASCKTPTTPALNTNRIKESVRLHHTPASIPVNAPGLLETPPADDLNKTMDEPTLKPVSQRFAAWNQKIQSPEPSKQPMSAKLANFEHKISQNTPRLVAMAGSVPIPKTPKQTPVSSLSASTPASTISSATNKTPSASSKVGTAKVQDPSELPVSQRMSQMQEKLSKKRQDEPTAYSVNARMSAWEDMTAANMVSEVKKVDPSQTTPYGGSKSRPASVFTPKPGAAVHAGTPKAASAPVNMASGGPPVRH